MYAARITFELVTRNRGIAIDAIYRLLGVLRQSGNLLANDLVVSKTRELIALRFYSGARLSRI
jgi:hypothetical protein